MFSTEIVITLITTIVLATASYFGSINAQETKLSQVKTDVAVLQSSDEGQDQLIAEVKNNVEYIRRVVEEQARRQGIVIKEKIQ
jgi:hypothetical protein